MNVIRLYIHWMHISLIKDILVAGQAAPGNGGGKIVTAGAVITDMAYPALLTTEVVITTVTAEGRDRDQENPVDNYDPEG